MLVRQWIYQKIKGRRYQLRRLEADGLIKLSRDRIEVTPVGRLLIRNIAAAFDVYLQKRELAGFSKAI